MSRVAPVAYKHSPTKHCGDFSQIHDLVNEEPGDHHEIPEVESPMRAGTTIREELRFEQSSNNRLVQITPTSHLTRRKDKKVFDPETWDPMAAERYDKNDFRGFTSFETCSLSPTKNVHFVDGNFAPQSPADEAKAHENAVSNYWRRVETLVTRGVSHAAGAGKRRPITPLPDEWLGGIAARVAPSHALLEHRMKVVAAREEVAKMMNPVRRTNSEEPVATLPSTVHEVAKSDDPETRRLVASLSGQASWALAAVQKAERAAEETLDEIRRGFALGVARSMVDYELRDPKLAKALEIDVRRLQASPMWWTSVEYQTYEWKVLRKTGVQRRRVHVAFHCAATKLRAVETIMLDLQRVWIENRQPKASGSQVSSESGSIAQSTAERRSTENDGHQESAQKANTDAVADTHHSSGSLSVNETTQLAFASMTLTDVKSTSFRRRLPLTLEVFCTYVERHASNVRETLRNDWLAAAANLLGSFFAKPAKLTNFDPKVSISGSQDLLVASSITKDVIKAANRRRSDHESGVLSNAIVSEESEAGDQAADLSSEGNDVDEFDAWFVQLYGATASGGAVAPVGQISKRGKSKGQQPPPTKIADSEVRWKTRERNESISTCASMLMSRHLRSLCEESLERFVEYLECFDSPMAQSTGEAAFELTLRLNDDKISASKNSSCSMGVVSIEPSLEQLQRTCCECIDTIVLGVKAFPRADSLIRTEGETVTAEKQREPSQKDSFLVLGLDEDDTEAEDPHVHEVKVDEEADVNNGSKALQQQSKSDATSHRSDNEAAIGPRHCLGPATIFLDDNRVLEAKARVKAALKRRFALPQRLVVQFDEFLPLLNNQLADSIQRVVAAGRRFTIIGTTSEDRSIAEATQCALAKYGVECRDLRNLKTRIRDATPDLVNFAMFQVDTTKVKEQLANRVDILHQTVTEAVAADNRDHMHEVCAKYQEVADALVDEPTTSAELKSLSDFSEASVKTLERLSKEYMEEILERTRFLLKQDHRISKDDLASICATYAWPKNIETFLQRSDELQDTRKKHLRMVVEGQREQLARDVSGLEKKVEKLAETSSLAPSEVQMVTRRVQAIREGLEAAQREAEVVASQEELLELQSTDHETRLQVIAKELAPLEKLWTIAREWVEHSHAWHELPLLEVDADDAARRASEYSTTLDRIAKQLEKKGESRAPSRRACKLLLQEVAGFEQDEVPLLRLVCEPGMQQRHWDEIQRVTRLSFDVTPNTNFMSLMDVGLNHYVHLIEEICIAAGKEAALDKSLVQMSNNWNTIQFVTKEWRSGRILTGIDEIQQELDDQLVKTQAMRGSRYVKPYISRVETWEKILTSLQEIIDNWLLVQAAWLYEPPSSFLRPFLITRSMLAHRYLEPIFGSDDITRQLPQESRLFDAVNQTWAESMETTYHEPNVLSVAQRDGLLESLRDANEKLERINKGCVRRLLSTVTPSACRLSDYLETKYVHGPNPGHSLLRILSA